MSYDLIIYTRRANLPDRTALAKRLAPRLALKNDLHWSGFLPVSVDGQDTGFELHLSALTDADRRDYEDDLRESGEQDQGFFDILNTSVSDRRSAPHDRAVGRCGRA